MVHDVAKAKDKRWLISWKLIQPQMTVLCSNQLIYLMKKFYMLKFCSHGRYTSMVHPGAGAGILFMTPERSMIPYSFILTSAASNKAPE